MKLNLEEIIALSKNDYPLTEGGMTMTEQSQGMTFDQYILEREGFIKGFQACQDLDGWQKTNYGLNPPVKCPLKDNTWYEIGHLNQFGGDFVHQGIRLFNDGFMDDDKYYLKPFPTHFKEIILTEPKQ